MRTSDGKYANRISSLAIETNTAIIYGYPEISDDRLFNSAQLFDSKGLSMANHRKKMLPPTANESKIFTPGQDSSIVSINGIKIAIIICYELEFPELIKRFSTTRCPVNHLPNWAVIKLASSCSS